MLNSFAIIHSSIKNREKRQIICNLRIDRVSAVFVFLPSNSAYPLRSLSDLQCYIVQQMVFFMPGYCNEQCRRRIISIYRRSPHFVIFGTKRVSRNLGITNFETLFSAKSQIGSKNFLKSTFLANFSFFESQNKVFFDIFLSSWKES